jgi:ribonuclease J
MNENEKPAGRPPRRNNRPAGKPAPKQGQRPSRNGQKPSSNNKNNGLSTSRGAAIRAQKRSLDDARKMVEQYSAAKPEGQRRANQITDDFDKLKISFLGGLEDVGEKNTAVIEYQNDAIILDCGNSLGIDLPGINYEIADPSYIESIKHKIRAYVITHGHLDHMGGLKHMVPKYPAPIYGSRFTLGIVEKTFEDMPPGQHQSFKPEYVIMEMDNHEKLKIGPFFVELIRVTHAIPEASAVNIETPVGRILATGDFRLDPEPLDKRPSDVARIKELGDQGVLLLLTESTNAEKEGRTPTESTLQDSFMDVITKANGRIFCAVFSSNMNRTQMIINAAVASGRKVALDGRSMMAYAEIAVRQGLLKVPKGTFMAIRDIAKIEDDKILIMCTGGQGEPNAALMRMSEGAHNHIKLKAGDTVLVSSTPIPGNEIRYDMIGNNLAKLGVKLYRHPTHEIDGCGPLHVSGHGKRDEMREMINMVRPKFIIPVHGGSLRRKYHADIAVEEGIPRDNVILAQNGQSYLLSKDKLEQTEDIPYGSLLVDQTGALVSGVVVKDRIILAEEGLVAIILTIDKKSGQLLTSPDIITRGFIYIRDSEELMNGLRSELRRAVQQRYKRIDLDRFKAELKDHVTHYLYDQTQRSPIVIPVVNVVGGGKPGNDKPRSGNGNTGGNRQDRPAAPEQEAPEQPKSPEDMAEEQKQRFEEMRARLLNQDPRTD